MSLLARRYATALFQAARDRGALAAVAGDIAALHGAFADARVRALLTSPDVSGVEREHVLGKLAEGRHQLVRNLLFLARDRQRLTMLPDLHPELRALVLEHERRVEGVVETARPLAPAETAGIERLAARLCGKQVTLTVQVRPELIGGIRLRLGHELYDGSVATALEQLEQQLLQTPV
jgi:F-type H+-transporting ATPase subunit delta